MWQKLEPHIPGKARQGKASVAGAAVRSALMFSISPIWKVIGRNARMSNVRTWRDKVTGRYATLTRTCAPI